MNSCVNMNKQRPLLLSSGDMLENYVKWVTAQTID